MEYRKANFSDIDILINLRIDMLSEETPLSDNQKHLIINNTKRFLSEGLTNDSIISWVAIKKQNIIGMGSINFFSFPPNDWCPVGKTAYIGNVYTIPDFRKIGIASNILLHLIDEAKSRHCQRILLNTSDKGRPLYEKLGFESSPTAMSLYPFGISS